MAYYYKDGTGIDQWAYIYVQLQVTRTDYATYSHFSVKSVAVSDTGTSSFIRGQVTTNQAGNSWTAATGWKDVSYNGTTTLATATFDVTRGASNKTAHIGAYAEGGGTGIYSGGTDYAWLDVTVPKVLAPNAPTGCTATYVSDSQATVSWTNGTTDSDHPRDNTLVERRDSSSDWTQIASASGTASSYADYGISPNAQYQYRVRAKNVAGYSAYSTGGSIYTTPAAPSSVTLDKTAATTVQVDVTGTWGYAVTYDIESTYGGGATWSTVATSTSLPYSATVNAGTVRFRVRAVRGSLSSAWALSASLVTICPPLAPTIVQAPANPTAYGDSSVISWTPNHPDGSTQSAAEVKVTNPSGTSTTYSVTTATSYTLATNATGTWTAQVRTKGLDPSYGEWSQTVSWGVHNPPAVVITSPATDGTDVVALPLNVAWTVTDPTGVSTQRIIIEGDGQILNRTLAGDVRTVALNASDVALENGQTYTIRLRVMGGSGLVTEQTRIFDVAWLAPAAPVLQLTEGEGRSATIDVMDTRYSESGSTIAVEGSAIADEFTVFGKSTQDGTPSPSSPVEIQSVPNENLLLFTEHPVYRGVQSQWTDGTEPTGWYSWRADTSITTTSDSIRFQASSAAADALVIPFSEPPKPNTYYNISFAYRGTVEVAQIHILCRTSPNAAVTSTYFDKSGEWTWFERSIQWTDNFSARKPYALMIPHTTNAQGWLEIKFGSMTLTEGYAPSAYAPYGSVAVASQGKNTCRAILNWNSSSVNGNALFVMADLRPSTTYTLSFVGAVGHKVYTNGSIVTQQSSITCTGERQSVTFTTKDTLPETQNPYGWLLLRNSSGNTVMPAFSDVQLEIGSTATPYQPYEGDTYTIDLQGNSLCSLPDGTRDELRVGERKVLVKRVGHIADVSARTLSYSGGSIPYVYFPLTAGEKGAPTSGSPARNNCMSTVAPPKVPLADPCCYVTNDGLTVVIGSTAFTSLATATTMLTGAEFDYVLATPQEIDLGAASDHPFIPDDGEMWVDGTTMEAVLRPADYAGQPTIQSVDVQRVNADGTAWTVATGLTVGGSCIDPLPPLGVPVTYRATSSAASGSTASVEHVEQFGNQDEWALNFGNAAGEEVTLRYDLRNARSLDHGGKSYHFADGGAGGGLPVFYPTTDRDQSGSLKFALIYHDDADRLFALSKANPVGWIRDSNGRRWRAKIAFRESYIRGPIFQMTADWQAVRWREAW